MKTIDLRPRHDWDKRLALPPRSVESIVHGSDIWHKAQIGMASVNDCWDQAIFVDDRLENVAAPQRLGIHGIRYVNGMDLPAALAPLLTVS